MILFLLLLLSDHASNKWAYLRITKLFAILELVNITPATYVDINRP
jgi:hypothetical protein